MRTINSPIEVTVIRRFSAAAERVFDVSLDPEILEALFNRLENGSQR
jgi:hypothetical protein